MIEIEVSGFIFVTHIMSKVGTPCSQGSRRFGQEKVLLFPSNMDLFIPTSPSSSSTAVKVCFSDGNLQQCCKEEKGEK